MSPQEKKKKADADKGTDLVLRLYIAGGAPNSVQALANIREICSTCHRDAFRLEIIDVLEHPGSAMSAGILVTPTLVKLSPPPVAQVVGNLSDRHKVLLAIGSKDEHHE